jgi:putative toxin-antitoxin system antitoxin component (TIGR02293 family)
MDKLAPSHRRPKPTLKHWLDSQTHAAAAGVDAPMTVKDIEAAWAPRFLTSEIEEVVIPKRTMARRRATSARLTPDEADRAVRLARVQLEADRVFANPEKASRWLRTPRPNLAGQTPLSLLRTAAGAMVVEEILGQIDHGMFA